MIDFSHTPVLLNEVMDVLELQPGMIVVDCTTGGGNHSRAMLQRILPGGRLIGLDQDQTALAAADQQLAPLGRDNYQLVHSNFVEVKKVMAQLGGIRPDAILMDLGVSSYQLDEAQRGFSYQHSGPLDMRMDQAADIPTAADLVNQWSEQELARVIWEYGEERWAKRIAQFIVEQRSIKPILTTEQLVAVIKMAVPAGARQEGPHPAKRTFQALRIAVNGELRILNESIEDCVGLLKPGGRLAVITFHSLEDRCVKNQFRQLAQGCICPKDLPVCQCHRVAQGKVITTKPILPSKEEVDSNPRSRSAKLRAFLKK